MKKLGAKKVAAIGYGASPSSSETAKATVRLRGAGAGPQGRATSTHSVDFGSTDVGPIVLGIKNSGADGVYLPLARNTNFAVVQGLQQNGVKMKANVLATGYSQDLLDQPIAKTITPERRDAVELQAGRARGQGDQARSVNDLKKYAGITGVPDYGVYTGYITCDMAILGLQNAGKNPTRQSFVDGLRNLTAASTTRPASRASPIDLSYEHFGKISRTTAASTTCR